MNILILTNDFSSNFIKKLKDNKKIKIITSYLYEDIEANLDLVFAYNYDKIIPEKYFQIPNIGIFVLHSSDLPKGRGWAPIYHSIADNYKEFVISLIKINKFIDQGNIFLKLKFDMPKMINNSNLRDIDESACGVVINHFIELCFSNKINKNTKGLKQDNSKSSYHRKRKPDDSFIDKDESISKSINKLLATSQEYSSFVIIDNIKVYLNAKIEKQYKLSEVNYIIETYI